MKLQRTWVMGLLLGLTILSGNAGAYQERRKEGSPRACEEREKQGRETAQCLDAGAFTATLVQVIESDTSRKRLVRLNIEFRNSSDDRTTVLGYRSHSSFLVDSYGATYFCCVIVEAPDKSVIGMGINVGNKVDPQFRLEPTQSDVVTFQVSRPRPPDRPSSYLRYDVSIEEIDPFKLTVRKRHILTFTNFKATWHEPRN
jgi:hypothetical protein